MKVFRLKEYSVSGENSLSRCEAERLSAYLRKKKLQNVVSLTPQGIVSKSFVGVIRCGNVQIEILPKILSANDDRREIMENLVYMLSYTRRLDIRTESGARLAACKNPFLEILIYEYASSLFDCLKKQPLRNYVTEETEVNFIKGKLMLPEQIRKSCVNRAKFYCQYDEFSENNMLNRLFLYVAVCLYKLSENSGNKRILRRIVNYYADVEPLPVSAAEANRIALTRNQILFKKPLSLAKMFVNQCSVDLSRNKIENVALVWDMNVLFEAFIGEVFKRKCPTLDIELQKGKRLLSEAGTGRKKCDTFVDIFEKNNKIVIDTKYKEFHSLKDVSNADVFQVMTYCMLHGAKRAILIYPQYGDVAPDVPVHRLNAASEDLGYAVQFKTVDLRRNLKKARIERELLEIVENFS